MFDQSLIIYGAGAAERPGVDEALSAATLIDLGHAHDISIHVLIFAIINHIWSIRRTLSCIIISLAPETLVVGSFGRSFAFNVGFSHAHLLPRIRPILALLPLLFAAMIPRL